nr:retrovirus-related Pol polyprotein from transposon TNT 1-94 [Tanacetum cinerariifolium]
MAAATDLDEIEEVNANCILMANLQQASTSGTQTDSAPVYDSDGSAEVHNYANCYDNEIFNMFTQEEQYTELLEPIPESHQAPQNDTDIISEDTGVEQGGETVEQHPVNFEETRALYESLYQNLAIKVEKVNSVNRKLKETNVDMTTELARFKNQERCFEISQEKYDKLERCYQQSVYQEHCLSKNISALHLSSGKQIMTLNEQISELNKQLSMEKSTVSFLLEEKKKLKSDFKTCKDELLDKYIQLEKRINELNNIVLKTGQSIQTIHILSAKPNSFYHTEQKMALGYQNPFYLKQAQKKQQSSYDVKVLLEKHDPPVVQDSEETPELAQESRDKMKQMNKEIKPANYTKINHLSGVFVSQKALSREELYFLNNSKTANVLKSFLIPNEDLSYDTTPSVVRVDNTKTRRPQPRSNTKNDRVPSASKSSRNKNKEAEVEEHHRNLLLSKNNKHISSACNNIKIDSPDNVNGKNSCGKNQKAKVSVKEIQKKYQPKVAKPKKVGSHESLATPKPRKPRFLLRWSPTGKLFNQEGKLVDFGNLKLLINFIWKFMGTVRFENDHVAAILGFGDLQWGNILITRVYFVEGLGHNLFSVGQFCDSDLEVAFRRDACFDRNLEGVDLLKGDRSTNLYTINLQEMASASPICLMARASSTKSWLWHQRLSHLNFETINDLARNDLFAGLPNFKYHKEHLCPSCEQEKSKRASHPPKPVPNSRQRLHLLHMDMCGPIRIASINGKRYVLVIVDDYSRYTWVHFLRYKDEAPKVIIKFLKRITVLLQSPVIIIRTDNGTEFKNQVLKEYFDTVGISHQMSSVRTPQQNAVVERRNQTLVEASRTMLFFSRVSLFLWAEAIAIAYIGKLSAKGDIGFFIGYSADSCAYRVYNRRTKKIIETMNVLFDELSAMAFVQRSSKPGLNSMTSGHISSRLDLTYAPSTITTQQPSEGELDLLFEAMYDDYFGGQPSATVRTVPPAQEPQVRQSSMASTTIADNAPIPINSSSHATNIPITSQDVDELNPNAMVDDNTFVNPFANPSTSAAAASSS